MNIREFYWKRSMQRIFIDMRSGKVASNIQGWFFVASGSMLKAATVLTIHRFVLSFLILFGIYILIKLNVMLKENYVSSGRAVTFETGSLFKHKEMLLFGKILTKMFEINLNKTNSSFIIDTPGCKITKLNAWDPTVIKFIQILGTYFCSRYPPFLTSEPNAVIHLNESVLKEHYNSSTAEDIDCWYQGIRRKHEEPGNIRENDYLTTEAKKLTFNVSLDEDYVVVKCFFSNHFTHEHYFPLVRLKKETRKEIPENKQQPPLNVILLGIESVSKLNFYRHFRHSRTFLKHKIKSYSMKGYTKVGDNTFPNLVPLLTGHFPDYFFNESLKDTFYFDNLTFIWKEFSRNKYKTFYAEDTPYSGTFNYLKRGFYDPPTDYYYRPMALAIENSEERQKRKTFINPCISSQLETDIMYDYLINFVKTMNKRPYFAFCMVSSLTHDDINYASFADEPARRVLETLKDEGVLNKSALVIFSDHGLRFGEIRQTYIGKFEELMPFMFIHIPQWFLNKHPDIERNLNINQNRLTTPFDLHATLKHLLHLDENFVGDKDELGLSLFHEIPKNRTCAEAHIKPHYCPCNDFKIVSVNDSIVQKLSQDLVDHLNNILLPHTKVCMRLERGEIKDARFRIPDKSFMSEEENVNLHPTKVSGKITKTLKDYLITLYVKPSGALFEATMQYDYENRKSTVLGISRLNMYGSQSWCIKSQILRLYCFCKKQPTKLVPAVIEPVTKSGH